MQLLTNKLDKYHVYNYILKCNQRNYVNDHSFEELLHIMSISLSLFLKFFGFM